ncbi:MAG: HAD-IIB family hydrolase [Micrococcales bacterium]|nr:HAD-IIB family hydrolase [Micrococcales bacterium]OJX69615.1 MAG: HAD family hydrolase [Micrococcales bacterium 72-143]
MNLDDVRLVAFDLDDTLAPSKSPLPARMRELLARLTSVLPVAVISGGDFSQFRRQLVDELAADPVTRLDRLHLLPACGTQYYRWTEDEWRPVYAELLAAEERSRIAATLRDGAVELGLWETETWGPVVEDRASQVTFSALGQEAPVDVKARWDPDGSRRARLRELVAPRLPGFEVRVGGSTSVDVTRAGIDKAYGLRRLAEHTGIPLAEMAFVGDQLQPGGNDHPVLGLGARVVAVRSWTDTADLLAAALPTATRDHTLSI